MITDEDDQRIADEEQKQREALCAELEAEFHPDTVLELEIVQRAGSVLWCLRRASLFESATIEAYRAEALQADPERQRRFREVFHRIQENPLDYFLKKHPDIKARLDALAKEQNSIPTPPPEPAEKKPNAKPDFSFVCELTFLETLRRHARYESLLIRELSAVLPELPRNKSSAKSNAASRHGAARPELILISGEDRKQFDNLRMEFAAQLTPRTAPQRELVEQIVARTWRLRRGGGFEAALLASARATFKRPANYRPQWAINGPNHPWLANPIVGGNPSITPAERQEEWKRIRAGQKRTEDKIAAILGDEAVEILPELWFVREREIQEKLEILARYQGALTRQLAALRRLLRSLQSQATETDSVAI
jgi:hypothetical protein